MVEEREGEKNGERVFFGRIEAHTNKMSRHNGNLLL